WVPKLESSTEEWIFKELSINLLPSKLIYLSSSDSGLLCCDSGPGLVNSSLQIGGSDRLEEIVPSKVVSTRFTIELYLNLVDYTEIRYTKPNLNKVLRLDRSAP